MFSFIGKAMLLIAAISGVVCAYVAVTFYRKAIEGGKQ